MSLMLTRWSRLLSALAVGAALTAAIGAIGLYQRGVSIVCLKNFLCQQTASTWIGKPQQIHVAPKLDGQSGVGVSWMTGGPVAKSTVDFKINGEDLWRSVVARSQRLPHNGVLGSRARIHHALLPDLPPDSVITYKVQNTNSAGDTSTSRTFRTKTLPKLSRFPLRFGFISDVGLQGRLDGLASGSEPLQRLLQHDDLDLLLGGGDYAYADKDGRFLFAEDAIDTWFREWEPILSSVPLLPQWGNHECCLSESIEQWSPRFQTPERSSPDGYSYSFDLETFHFVSFFAPGTGEHVPSDESLEWLDQDLSQARSRGQEWLIVFQHEPIFGHGKSHPARPEVRATLAPLMERHFVDLHISSHDQSYERTFPLRNVSKSAHLIASKHLSEYAQGEGVIYAKVSPSGKRSEITQGFSTLPEEMPDMIAVSGDEAYHYAVLVLESASRIVFYGYAFDESVERRVLDKFAISR